MRGEAASETRMRVAEQFEHTVGELGDERNERSALFMSQYAAIGPFATASCDKDHIQIPPPMSCPLH